MTFEAWDGAGVSLGIIGPFPVGDGDNYGKVGEDRFFGVFYEGGISAIKITEQSNGGIEIDHVQYGLNGVIIPDADDDGIPDAVDNCPIAPNTDQADADLDGMGDVCDPCPFDWDNDADDDGVCGDEDNCPDVANLDQFDMDGDGAGDACDPDDDNDGVPDGDDNCPFDFNPGQEDFDSDGIGNICDADDDGDGVVDADDQCLGTYPDEVVNSIGCSIADLCPCVHPWKNHGAYISSVVKTAKAFLTEGLIDEGEMESIIALSAQKDCGKKK